ncbi:hypothetical protein [Paenibacillus sp. Marseille-Q7038]
MNKYAGLHVLLGVVVILCFVTIETLWPDLNYKLLIYLGLVVAVLFIIKGLFKKNKISYKMSTSILFIFLAVTVVSQFIYSNVVLDKGFFDNDHIIFMGVIYLLIWMRLWYMNKSKQQV